MGAPRVRRDYEARAGDGLARGDVHVSNQQETFRFDGWAIIEFMGHRKRAGQVKTADIGGTAVFQVTTQTPDGQPLVEVYAASSLYCLTPVTEDVARNVAERINPAPISAWDLPTNVREAMRAMQATSANALPDAGDDDPDDFDDCPL